MLTRFEGFKNKSFHFPLNSSAFSGDLKSTRGNLGCDGINFAISEGTTTRQRSPTESDRHARPKRE